MSGKTFFGKIFAAIAKFFKGLPAKAKEAIHIGVVITEAINKFVQSDTADIITAIIPGNLDDKIKEKLREKLPVILIQLRLANDCAGLTNPDEIVQCGIKTLQSTLGTFKNDFLDALSVQIAVVAADGKLDWDDAKSTLKWYYDHVYKPAA